jgi:SnoaL-like protein
MQMLQLHSANNFSFQFSSKWIENWNNRDIDAVISHFTNDCTFESPIALELTGRSVLHGKNELRAYWNAAMKRINSLRFTLVSSCWDRMNRTLCVCYLSEVNGFRMPACESMVFDADGMQISGHAYYGAKTRISDDAQEAPAAVRQMKFTY